MGEIARYYFAYGSNMNPDRVVGRGMQFESHRAGQLHGYRMIFNKRSVKYPGAASANVVQQSGAVTEGVLYRLLEPAQIEMMDPFEGFPVRYNRLALPVETREGQLSAWVYIANAEFIEDGLQPARWYLEHLLAGKLYLSADYYRMLEATRCLPDSEVEPL